MAFPQGGNVKRPAVRLVARLLSMLLALAFSATTVLEGKPVPSTEGQVVDSGSFGVFRGGKRIATESFRIQQHPEYSVTTAELRVEDGSNKVTQSSELQISANGDLRKYSWKGFSPDRAEVSVEPGDQFLNEEFTVGEIGRAHV